MCHGRAVHATHFTGITALTLSPALEATALCELVRSSGIEPWSPNLSIAGTFLLLTRKLLSWYGFTVEKYLHMILYVERNLFSTYNLHVIFVQNVCILYAYILNLRTRRWINLKVSKP